jgi:prepilin-type N-terminal cleavage/methylation domain-containing protein
MMRRVVPTRRGFTLIEATISLVIVSVVGVAGLSAVSIARKSRASINDMILARSYADAMMMEILNKRYRDEGAPNSPLGPDAGDDLLNPFGRDVDDVDDYNDHTITPISDADGAWQSDGNWGAGISVSWADLTNPNVDSAVETGMKRVSVAIFKGNRVVLRTTALRTLGADIAKGVETP